MAPADLIDAVLTREAQRLLTGVMAAADAAGSRAERIAASFAATVIAVRTNEVWCR